LDDALVVHGVARFLPTPILFLLLEDILCLVSPSSLLLLSGGGDLLLSCLCE